MTQIIDIKLKWLEDALSESTRKARRNLLAIGGSAIFLIKGELMPSKISALGISIESVQKETILTALLVLSSYYFIKFYLYAFVDGERHVVVQRLYRIRKG